MGVTSARAACRPMSGVKSPAPEPSLRHDLGSRPPTLMVQTTELGEGVSGGPGARAARDAASGPVVLCKAEAARSSVKLEGKSRLTRTENKRPGSGWAEDGRHSEQGRPAQEGRTRDTTRTHDVRVEGLHVGLAGGAAREGPDLGFMLESSSHLQRQNGRLIRSNFRSCKSNKRSF